MYIDTSIVYLCIHVYVYVFTTLCLLNIQADSTAVFFPRDRFGTAIVHNEVITVVRTTMSHSYSIHNR